MYSVLEGGPGLQGPWGKRRGSNRLSRFHTLTRRILRWAGTGPGKIYAQKLQLVTHSERQLADSSF